MRDFRFGPVRDVLACSGLLLTEVRHEGVVVVGPSKLRQGGPDPGRMSGVSVVSTTLVHTGQHYDARCRMPSSPPDIPRPDVNLKVPAGRGDADGRHHDAAGAGLVGARPDVVVVVGM